MMSIINSKYTLFSFIIFLCTTSCFQSNHESGKDRDEWYKSELDEYFYTFGKSPISCENSRMKRIRLCFGNKLSDSRCLLLQTHVGRTQYILTENIKKNKDSVIIKPIDSTGILQLFNDLQSKLDCRDSFVTSFTSLEVLPNMTWSPYYAGSLEVCENEDYCIQLFYTDSLHLIPEQVQFLIQNLPEKIPTIVDEL